MAVDGSTALVGAPGKDSGAGAAYIFGRSGGSWSQHVKLTRGARDAFGASVAISDSTAVVGAYRYNAHKGATFVFKRRPLWSHGPRQIAPDAAFGDEFGWSVAVDGSTAVVGAPRERARSGAAYVFADGCPEHRYEATPATLAHVPDGASGPHAARGP